MALSLSGVPPPEMAWYKDATLIHLEKLSRFQLLADGSLQISGLVPDDTGMFQCFARNAAGEVQTTTYLAVTSRCQHSLPWMSRWDVPGTLQMGSTGRSGTPGNLPVGTRPSVPWEPLSSRLSTGKGFIGGLCVCLPYRHCSQHHQGSPGQHSDRWHVCNPQLRDLRGSAPSHHLAER